MLSCEVIENGYCEYTVKYEDDQENVISKRNDVIDYLRKTKDVKGYRKGKATREAIYFHYKNEIPNLLRDELARDAFQKSMVEKNLKPFGGPIFKEAQLEGNKFTCEFSIHTHPEFELKQYKNFELPKPAEQNIDEMAQQLVQDLRVKYGDMRNFTENDIVELNDSLIVNYKAFDDDNQIESLTADGEILTVGTTPIPEFDNHILGMKLNESREFTVEIPQGVKHELAGKSIKFNIELVNGSKCTPAPLDETLAKKLNLQSMDQVFQHANGAASHKKSEGEKVYLFNQISKRLIDNHDFKIPSWISVAEAKMNAKNATYDWDKISDAEKEKFVSYAEDSIKLSLILSKIRENEPDAQLTYEEVFNIARNNLSKYSPEPDKVLSELAANGHLAILANKIKDEFTLEFIKNNSKLIE